MRDLRALFGMAAVLALAGCGGGGGTSTGGTPVRTAPTPSLTVTPASGTTATVFQFNASGCSDTHDSAAQLQVCWDWGGDGTYDTAYSATKTATHQFATAGTISVRVRVRNTANLTAVASRTVTVTASSGGGAHGLTRLFFLHHSVGDGLVVAGQMREWLAANATSYTFWDQGYNADGLRNAAGAAAGSYDIPDDNTDIEGLYNLWTSAEARFVTCRNLILAQNQVIAFKACFTNSAIVDTPQIDQYKVWYLAMRGFFDTRTDRLFVVIPPPPLHRLATTAADASRARAFATWLSSAQFLTGHPNVRCFNLFDHLARANDGTAAANMLRFEYEGSHDSDDSHPNELGNQTVGPAFARFLRDAAAGY